jgi:hypothetical protein
MATLSIDYDSNGDVELILEQKDDICPNQTLQETWSSSKKNNPGKYNVGPLSIQVKNIHLRVSSLKLISSSRHFQAMLEGPAFREHQELKENGFVAIELSNEEDDPTAMMVIMGILHGTDVQVPAQLDLLRLYKIAVLVDKYQWQTLMTPHGISWLDNLLESQGLPDAFDETLLMWLWTAWLFGKKDDFKNLSRIAQQNICNPIDLTDENIRLPTSVLSK